jgi:hypothetical protein
MRGLLFIGFLTLLAAPSLRAQRAAASFEQWEASQVAAAGGQPSAAVVTHRDYRHEGLAVGGLALGALGAWIGSRLTLACPTEPGVRCDTDRLGDAVALGLVGMAVGGGVGYLVGRLSPKRSTGASLRRSPSGAD